MKSKIALRVSYVLLAICLAALVFDLGAYLMHIRYPDNIRLPLHVISFLWPLALALVAIFGWKPRTPPAGTDKSKPTT
jgi:hypothetical protein